MFKALILFLVLSKQAFKGSKSVDATFAQQSGNYLVTSYLTEHEILNDFFEFSSNGEKSGYPITNIINDANTYWVSENPCSDSNHPAIMLNFSKTVTLEAFLYYPAYRSGTDSRAFDGHPLKLNVYAAIDNGPYELKVVFTGEEPTSLSWSATQFVFPTPIKCDKLKLEFITVTPCHSFNQNGATVAALRRIRILGAIDINHYTSIGVSAPYNTANYVNPRKIPKTDFTYSSTGDKERFSIDQAFDDNAGTYWVSAPENSDTFKATITIEFNEVKTIDAFLYDTAFRTRYPDTGTVRYFDGFPTVLNVYSSLESTGDSFLFDTVFEGNPVFPWEKIQFVFAKPITCKRLKLEFYNVTADGSFSGGIFAAATRGITFLKYIAVPPATPTPLPTPMATPTPSPLPAYLNLAFAKAEGDYANANYVNEHMIKSEFFEATSNGDKSGNPLSNALDNNRDTFWVSSEPNSDTFKATITFAFTRKVSLEAFLFHPAYHTRPPIRIFDGFPLRLNFYASNDDGPFEIVASFTGEKPTSTSWDLTQFVFHDKIRCDKLKVEFFNVTENDSFSLANKTQAAAMEMKLIGELAPEFLQVAPTADDYNNPQYVASHRVPVTEFTYKSNGDKSNYPIDNAFDRGGGSYWVAGQETSDTFKSVITVEFKQLKTIDAILYDTAYRTRYPSTGTVRYFDGFPTKMNIYTSTTETEDESSYLLDSVFEGNPVFPWMRVQFVFKRPIQCRRIKLEFVEVTEDGSFSNGKRVATAGDIIMLSSEEQLPDPTSSPKPTKTPTATPRPTPMATLTATPMPTSTPTASISMTPMPTNTPMATPTPSPMATPTASPSPDPMNLPFEKANGDYANANYINEHKISSDYFVLTTNGDKDNYPISNVLDDNTKTFWVSSEPNSDTFKAAVTFEFTKKVSLEAFILNPAYHTRPPIRYFDGFPLRLNFYASIDDGPFEIVHSFTGEKPTSTSWDATQFVFIGRVRCDKLKVEFFNVTENDSFSLANKKQAAANEMKVIGDIEPDSVESIGVEGIYNISDYTESHIIQTSDFTYSSSGDKSGKPISNAFDGSPTTYWVAGAESTDSFKSTITIDFNEIKTLDAILIDPAYRTRYPETGTVRHFDGFPSKLNVYSTQKTGDTFILDTIFEGEPHYPWSTIQFVFKKPIKCRRLKLEFAEVTPDESFSDSTHTAAVGEITLLQDAERPPLIPPETSGTVEVPPGHCNHKYRCDQNITEEKNVVLDIKETNFNDYRNEKDGGAISLINCGFDCEKTEFNHCTSTKGGGAIFYKNTLDSKLNLENINFTSCSAVFGGAAYVCSTRSEVSIHFCQFYDATLIPPGPNSGEFYGGSALFLTVTDGNVNDLYFKRCQGTTLKVYPGFNYEPMSLHLSQKVVSIKKCTFESFEKSEASIFYVRGAGSSTSTLYDVVECTFKGTLKPGYHFIEGKSVSNKSPKLVVSRCRFASSLNNAFNIDRYEEFLSIDLKEQEFSGAVVAKDEKWNNLKVVLAIAAPALLVVTIIVVVAVVVAKKRKNPNNFDQVEMSVEISQDFNQQNDSQNSLNQPLI